MQACTTRLSACRSVHVRPAAAAAASPRAPAPRTAQHEWTTTRLQSVSQVAVTAAASRSQQQAVSLTGVLNTPEVTHPEAWQQCVQHIQGLGFTELDAGVFVQRAFGWGAKARSYWRHEKRDAAPDLQQILAVVTFLQQQLGMDDLQVAKTIKAFPEVLGCAVDSQLAGNVSKLQQEWKLQGDVLRGAVLRNPALLGYNVDCLGDCAGECNRCWVRF